MIQLIPTYFLLHFTKRKFETAKAQIQFVYSGKFDLWTEITSLVTKKQMEKLKVSTTSH